MLEYGGIIGLLVLIANVWAIITARVRGPTASRSRSEIAS